VSTNPSLTATQDQVLAMIAAGFTATAAAERAGVHRNTIAYWLRSEEFRNALEKARGEKEILYWDQAEALAAEAINHLRSMMYDSEVPASVRVKATVAMLEHARLFLPDTCAIVTAPVDEEMESPHKNAQTDAAPQAPSRISTPKIGRNELCSCGSGIKFKYCCLGKAVPPNENAPAA
jgi:hypothetical protein